MTVYDDEKPVYVGTCNTCGYQVIGTKPKVCKGCGLKVEDEQ
jgi:rubrerythrin